MNEIVIEVPNMSDDGIRQIYGSNDERVVELADGNPGAATVLRKAKEWFDENPSRLEGPMRQDPDNIYTYSAFLQFCVTEGWQGPTLWYEYKNVCGGNIEALILKAYNQ